MEKYAMFGDLDRGFIYENQMRRQCAVPRVRSHTSVLTISLFKNRLSDGRSAGEINSPGLHLSGELGGSDCASKQTL